MKRSWGRLGAAVSAVALLAGGLVSVAAPTQADDHGHIPCGLPVSSESPPSKDRGQEECNRMYLTDDGLELVKFTNWKDLGSGLWKAHGVQSESEPTVPIVNVEDLDFGDAPECREEGYVAVLWPNVFEDGWGCVEVGLDGDEGDLAPDYGAAPECDKGSYLFLDESGWSCIRAGLPGDVAPDYGAAPECDEGSYLFLDESGWVCLRAGLGDQEQGLAPEFESLCGDGFAPAFGGISEDGWACVDDGSSNDEPVQKYSPPPPCWSAEALNNCPVGGALRFAAPEYAMVGVPVTMYAYASWRPDANSPAQPTNGTAVIRVDGEDYSGVEFKDGVAQWRFIPETEGMKEFTASGVVFSGLSGAAAYIDTVPARTYVLEYDPAAYATALKKKAVEVGNTYVITDPNQARSYLEDRYEWSVSEKSDDVCAVYETKKGAVKAKFNGEGKCTVIWLDKESEDSGKYTFIAKK